ncbi:uncharacterized protein LOC134258598 [Saccostrea cucullata]|uniref:uncharacterized protein LOC134258598 n=1 Tax=Saccostrea cuccullata TaxID=36930 RepID=UPI002ED6AFA4
MYWITSTFIVLLCIFLKAESLLVHGQINATSASQGHSDPDVYKQLLHMEKVFDSIMMDQKQQATKNQQFEQQQKLLEGEIQRAQVKITVLENSLLDVQSENKILKKRLDNLNSSSILTQQNLTTKEDLQRLENTLSFEIEQTVRDSEQKMMKNMSTTVKDLEQRDRYLSLSLFDVHNNMTMLNVTLSKFKQQQKIQEEQQNMTIQHLSLSLLDVHNNTAWLPSSVLSLDAQQQKMKSEIEAMSNSQKNNIANLNDTIIHLKNSLISNVAFTAGTYGSMYTDGETVKFPKIIFQVGGGYNPTTGVFTAPKAGLYLIFSTNVAVNNKIFWTKIMINGSEKAGVMAWAILPQSNVYQSGSNLVIYQLQMGDRVWMQVYIAGTLYPETYFSVIRLNGLD